MVVAVHGWLCCNALPLVRFDLDRLEHLGMKDDTVFLVFDLFDRRAVLIAATGLVVPVMCACREAA